MLPQINNYSSHLQSNSMRQQRYLINYFVKQIGIKQQIAQILINFHKCKSKTDVLQLMMINEDGLYPHLYLNGSNIKNNSKQSNNFIKIEDIRNDNYNYINEQLFSQSEDNYCTLCQKQQQFHVKYQYQLNTNHIMDQSLKKNQQSRNQINNEQQYINFNRIKHKNNNKLKRSVFNEQNSQQSRKNQQNVSINHITCQICYISYQQKQIINFQSSYHNVCKFCMSSYLQQRILNMNVTQIHCPHCEKLLNKNTIKLLINHQLYKKYIYFLKNIQIQNNPNLIWCPNPKCSIVISIKKRKERFINLNSKISCPKCECKICMKCNNEDHGKKSCKSVFKNQIKNWQSNFHIQKCKKCNAIIQKISGCNHVTCSVCGHEWCWLCGAYYTNIHFSPFNPFGCPGMQDQHSHSKIFIYFKRILLFLLILIVIPILLPIGLLFTGPFIIIDYAYRKVQTDSICAKIFIVLVALIVGISLNPFFWIGLIAVYFPVFLLKCKKWIKDKKRRAKYSQRKIYQRLINNALDQQTLIYQENQNK